jgi:hypothetical protein
MPRVKHTVVTLRFFGDALDPQELTERLGAIPTKSAVKGDVTQSASGSIVAKSGKWNLTVECDSSANDLDGLIGQLFEELTSDLDAWQDLSSRFAADLFVGMFLGASNEGAVLTSETISAIGTRGLGIGFDIYDSGAER